MDAGSRLPTLLSLAQREPFGERDINSLRSTVTGQGAGELFDQVPCDLEIYTDMAANTIMLNPKYRAKLHAFKEVSRSLWSH